jgi:hypothetical protein
MCKDRKVEVEQVQPELASRRQAKARRVRSVRSFPAALLDCPRAERLPGACCHSGSGGEIAQPGDGGKSASRSAGGVTWFDGVPSV